MLILSFAEEQVVGIFHELFPYSKTVGIFLLRICNLKINVSPMSKILKPYAPAPWILLFDLNPKPKTRARRAEALEKRKVGA